MVKYTQSAPGRTIYQKILYLTDTASPMTAPGLTTHYCYCTPFKDESKPRILTLKLVPTFILAFTIWN